MNNSSQDDSGSQFDPADEAIDFSDIPPLEDRFFERAELRIPAAQAKAFVQLDPDVLAWFQAKGPGYRAIVNDALRSFIGGN